MEHLQDVALVILQAIVGNGPWLVLWCVVGGFALVEPRLRARGWLIASAVLFVVGVLWHMSTFVVQSTRSVDFYLKQLWSLEVVAGAVHAAGGGCLLGFVFSQRSSAGSQLSFRSILFSFRGRIARQHYWIASVALGIVGWVPAGVIIGSIASTLRHETDFSQGRSLVVAQVVSVLWTLLAAWPAIAVQVKRWHDRNKPGHMVLVNLIPIVGPIWSLVENGFLSGASGPNAYGEDPLSPARETHVSEEQPIPEALFEGRAIG
jgi:uncharacterized membrane protein YhaH (DUF805 family)